MSTKRLTCLAALLASTAVSLPAQAQQAPPDNAIDDRTRQQVRLPSEEEPEEALLTGDTDIVLTRPTRLFNVHGDVESVLTDNAFLTEVDPVTDAYVQAQMGLGVGTRIGGKLDLFADASIVSVRYLDAETLDYGAVSGVIGASLPVGRVRLSAAYQPVMVFERDFTSRQLTTHRFRLAASLPFAVGKVLAEPQVYGERTVAHPADYSAWSGGGGLTLSTAPIPRLPLVAFGTIGYQRREFDSYFPGLIGVVRKDDVMNAGIGIAWRPGTWGEVRLAWNFQRNWSTSDVNRYQTHSGHLGVAARLRF